jgi:hypothetical protein
MLKLNAVFLLVIFVWQASCSPDPPIKLRDVNSGIPNPGSTAAETPGIRDVKELSAMDSNLIYGDILTSIYYGSRNPERFRGFDMDKFSGNFWYCYRRKTIVPKYTDKISGTPGVTDELVRELARIDRRQETLWDELGDKLNAKAVSGDEDPGLFLIKAKKKYPMTKAVLGFSGIALSGDASRGLVYVEYYSEERNLIGMYFLITLVPRTNGTGFSSVSEIPREFLVFDSKQ